jgi:hypothetical protein
MKYLDNNICKFTPLFNNLNFDEKKNIVSCAFFKLHTSPYKDFNLYINGLEKLYDKVYNQYRDENFTIRLFIDNSIYEDKKLFARLEKMNMLEIVLYSCVNYQIGTDLNYHMGLFGTLVRFFPMFDFENNDANTVIISDIDDYNYFEKSIENIKLIKSNIRPQTNLCFFKAGNISKNVLYKISSFYKNIPNPYAVASNFISFARCDKQVLYDFLIEISESDELLTKYKHKFESNANLLTGDKFVYGFDEYFLNINYTNYLIDMSKIICVKFKWSVYGSLFWFLNNKYISQYQIDLINNMLKYIYQSIGYNFIKNNDIRNKFKILEKIIYKNNQLSEKVLYCCYDFFLSVENDDRYRFLFEENIYKLIKKYDLFGIYDFEIITFISTNSEYFNFISKKTFNQNQISELKKKYPSAIASKTKTKTDYSKSPSRMIQINKKNPIDLINCDIEFIENLSTKDNIWVDYFNLNGQDVVVKKELYDNNNVSTEYNFFTKYSNTIVKSKFDKFILLPNSENKIMNCQDSKNKWHIYIFDKLDFDYNNEFIQKLNFKQWIKYTIEICLLIYYINNTLHIYHNDLCYKNDIRNIMIKKNTAKTHIIVNNYDFEINDDYPVIIDFGHQSTKPKLRTWRFYNNKYVKRSGIKYISEVFIVYYYSFKSYFKFDDYWDTKYDDLYFSIQSKSSSLEEFDSNILNSLMELYNKNK